MWRKILISRFYKYIFLKKYSAKSFETGPEPDIEAGSGFGQISGQFLNHSNQLWLWWKVVLVTSIRILKVFN